MGMVILCSFFFQASPNVRETHVVERSESVKDLFL
jgi:hypothetical protein